MKTKKIKEILKKIGYSSNDSPIGAAHVQLIQLFLKEMQGNPVPSLDEIIKEFQDKICENKNQYLFIDKFRDFYKMKQNGVETNKEQPKCRCGFDKDVCKNTCSKPVHLHSISWSSEEPQKEEPQKMCSECGKPTFSSLKDICNKCFKGYW